MEKNIIEILGTAIFNISDQQPLITLLSLIFTFQFYLNNFLYIKCILLVRALVDK